MDRAMDTSIAAEISATSATHKRHFELRVCALSASRRANDRVAVVGLVKSSAAAAGIATLLAAAAVGVGERRSGGTDRGGQVPKHRTPDDDLFAKPPPPHGMGGSDRHTRGCAIDREREFSHVHIQSCVASIGARGRPHGSDLGHSSDGCSPPHGLRRL